MFLLLDFVRTSNFKTLNSYFLKLFYYLIYQPPRPELRQPLVGLSDGSTAAKLTCVMYGVLTDDMKKGISAFWMENGKKSFHTPTFTG